MQFITEHNLFWLIPMFIVAFGMTLLLYWKETKNEYSKVQAILLGTLRVISLFLLFFLLLHPLLLHKVKNIEKPLIIIAQDNSQSIILNPDSNFYKKQYLLNLQNLKEKLKEKFEVKTVSFGNEVKSKTKIDFLEKSTNISAVGSYIYNYYGNRNIGAIVMATDGIYNQGQNPFFSFQKLNSPIYCIAMGDTSVKKDISIQNIRHNKIAFKGNSIPIEIKIKTNHCQGEQVLVQLKNKGKTLFEEKVKIQKDQQLLKLKKTFIAQNLGVQHYTVTTTKVKGEVTYANNKSSFYIDILESKEKILILYQAPHPDISAIRQSLESSRNYEIDVFNINKFSTKLSDYNLVILHALPSLKFPIQDLLKKAKSQEIPLFFILSQSSDLITINNYLKVLKIQAKKSLSNDVSVSFNSKFSKFSLSSAHSKIWNNFPPLKVPFGDYDVSPSLNTLFFQQIHNMNTQLPLLAFSEAEDTKNAILCGDGVWRWRLANYQLEKNHLVFDELFNKTVQFLSLKIRRKPFTVSAKKQYRENENIQIDAQLFDENYEPTKAKEVSIDIINDKGEKFSFLFHQDGEFYKLNAASLPPGKYHYIAKTFFNNKEQQEKGQFIIYSTSIEKARIQANHHLLFQFSKASNGKVFTPKDMTTLAQELLQNPNLKPLIRYEQRFIDFLDFIFLLSFIILLLSLEWFLRKRFGGY